MMDKRLVTVIYNDFTKQFEKSSKIIATGRYIYLINFTSDMCEKP